MNSEERSACEAPITVEADDSPDGAIREIALKHAGGGPAASHVDGTEGKGLRIFTTPVPLRTVRFPDAVFGESFVFSSGEIFQLTIKDFPGNESTPFRFTIDRTPPDIRVSDRFGPLGDGAQTPDNHICATASDELSGVASLELFEAGAIVPTASGSFCRELAPAAYEVKACDGARNCGTGHFAIASDGGCVPDGSCNAPNPVCGQTTTGTDNCGRTCQKAGLPCEPCPGGLCRKDCPNPAGCDEKIIDEKCKGRLLAFLACNIRKFMEVLLPHDPNIKFGPEGQVSPGQLMTYVVEFENTGEGAAIGVYVEDVLDPSLDDTALVVKDFLSVDFLNNTQAPASFPFVYDPLTRTLTVYVGEAGPRQGGRFTFETRLRSDAPPGTVITNQALVHFPNALEITPTNPIVSVVPLPTEIAYVGQSTASFSDTARLQARLASRGKSLPGKTVEFHIAQTSRTAVTDVAGIGTAYRQTLELPGSYPLEARFPGDGFYYLPSSTKLDFGVNKETVLLSRPFARAPFPGTVQLMVNVTDDEFSVLLLQQEEPKTVFLEAVEPDGSIKALSQSVVSGTAASFQFPFPEPAALSKTIRAHGAWRPRDPCADNLYPPQGGGRQDLRGLSSEVRS